MKHLYRLIDELSRLYFSTRYRICLGIGNANLFQKSSEKPLQEGGFCGILLLGNAFLEKF